MKVVILDDYQEAVKNLNCYRLLEGHEVTVVQDLHNISATSFSKLKEAEVLVLIRERTKITEDFLSSLPNLKLISQTGKIANHIDLETCNKYKVLIAEGVGSPIAPAELTWALILNAQRKIPQAIEDMKNGLWQTNIGTTLKGQTLGIWGYGKIGKKIATYAKAFDMTVQVWGSEKSLTNAESDGFIKAQSKEIFFKTSDIVSLNLRLVPETTGIVKLTDLQQMKSESIFVNTSRAELVEKDALIKALKSGKPGFAALDVYEDEPVFDKEFPLLKMPNVICTPHLGYVEKNGYELYFSKAFENINNFAKGRPENIINLHILM